MTISMKEVRRSYLTLFAIALIVAIIGRIGLAVMDLTGVLTYDYIAASTGTLLNQVCSALTGPAFMAFMFVAGLVLVLSTAGVALYGLCYGKGAQSLAQPKWALAAGGATTLAALVCMLVPASAIMSSVQIASMKTKLTMDGGMLFMGLMFLVAITTLLAAASLVVCACVARAKTGSQLEKNLVVATAVCGLIVMVLTVCTFASINVAHLDGMTCALWFALDAVVNVGMIAGATLLIRKAVR